MEKSKTFHFRRRTSATSYDPYDSLTNKKDSHSLFFDSSKPTKNANNEEYWTNGNTVYFSSSGFSMEPPPLSSPIATSTTIAGIDQRKNIPVNAHDNNNNMNSAEIQRFSSAGFLSTLPNNSVVGSNDKNLSKSNSESVSPLNYVKTDENEVRKSILAGSIAGIASCAIFHPFDVVRTKMQATTKLIETSTVNTKSNSLVNSITTKPGITSSSGPVAVISHTYKNGGIRAFYTGISLPLVAQALYKSTVLTTNRVATNVLTEWKTEQRWKTGLFAPYKMSLSDHFICGSISGAVNALLFVCPVEFIRNQLIQQHTKRAQGTLTADKIMTGPVDVIKTTVKTDGFLGLWRGAGVTLVRDSVGCGAFFIMNDVGKKNISAYTGYEEGTLPNTIGSGFMAGFGYWFVSLPLDALKTLVQTGKSTSAMETFSYLVKRDGSFGAVMKLYRGWQLAFSRGSPSAAVTLSTYSVVYNFCGGFFG